MYPSTSQKYRLLEMVALCGEFPCQPAYPVDPKPLLWRKAYYRAKGSKTAADSLSGSFKGLSPDRTSQTDAPYSKSGAFP